MTLEKRNEYYILSEELLKNFFEKYPCLINKIVPNELLDRSKHKGKVDYPTLKLCKHEERYLDIQMVERLKVFREFQDPKMFDDFIKLMFDYHARFCKNFPDMFNEGKYKYQKYSETLNTIILGNPTLNEKIELFVKSLNENKVEFKGDYEDFNKVYRILFVHNERHSYEVVTKIVDGYEKAFKPLLQFVRGQDRENLVKQYPLLAYKQCKNWLSHDLRDYVTEKARELDRSLVTFDKSQYKNIIEEIVARNKSNLLKKLKDRYGKSYASINNIEVENIDDEKFILALLTSKTFEQIYPTPLITMNDEATIYSILNYFDQVGINTSSIRSKITNLSNTLFKEERAMTNYITPNINNKEKVDE